MKYINLQMGAYAYEIFDAGVYDRVKQIAAYDHLGLIESAKTLPELAKKIKVDAKKDTDFERSELLCKIEPPRCSLHNGRIKNQFKISGN